ncbi:MAG: 6-phosphofructokinase [candidate division Zixibacteria bacterium]|jgi:6-phosphofructokinase 1|nr:6-phosphofructokinase [candidate division Zixibacteria bacterium]
MIKLKKIGLLTSGGDSPGMNPCIRAVFREAAQHGIQVMGIRRGFAGLLDNDMFEMNSNHVSGIIQKGGTILLTARCEEFKYEEAQKEAINNLVKNECDALIVIGGDGSFHGAQALAGRGLDVIGIPGSIDNDIYGSDMSLGVDTAMNNIIEAVDKIKDTASSHERTFIIETMGRGSGYLALMSAIATGAEAAIIPEVKYDLEKIAARIKERYKQGKVSNIIIVAEGASTAYQVARQLSKIAGIVSKITVLGHLQRGGSPSGYDRTLASRLGSAAVLKLLEGYSGCMVGLVKGEIKVTTFENVFNNKRELGPRMIELAEVLGK